jgi:hypothetical protein
MNRNAIVPAILCLLICFNAAAQNKSIAVMKKELDSASNGPLYAKTVLKKQIVIDTIVIQSLNRFQGLVDSLAYHGKVGKTYGPFAKGKILVQILAKAPNTFNHVGQIFLDTSIFSKRFADSLATDIIKRIQSGKASFADMAVTYSMGGEGLVKGDLGWMAAGSMQPQIESSFAKIRKGDLFKIWSKNGVHIIRKMDDSKQAPGFVLIMKVLL